VWLDDNIRESSRVSERGNTLSGGQKATHCDRSRNPAERPILILDEPTGSLNVFRKSRDGSNSTSVTEKHRNESKIIQNGPFLFFNHLQIWKASLSRLQTILRNLPSIAG
jgi:hypothetical protein